MIVFNLNLNFHAPREGHEQSCLNYEFVGRYVTCPASDEVIEKNSKLRNAFDKAKKVIIALKEQRQ